MTRGDVLRWMQLATKQERDRVRDVVLRSPRLPGATVLTAEALAELEIAVINHANSKRRLA